MLLTQQHEIDGQLKRRPSRLRCLIHSHRRIARLHHSQLFTVGTADLSGILPERHYVAATCDSSAPSCGLTWPCMPTANFNPPSIQPWPGFKSQEIDLCAPISDCARAASICCGPPNVLVSDDVLPGSWRAIHQQAKSRSPAVEVSKSCRNKILNLPTF